MSTSVSRSAVVAGILTANSLEHLASAAAGKEHLTPLAGRHSGPVVNGVWGAANLVGGLLLVRRATREVPPSDKWDRRLLHFGAGVAAFAVWGMVSEPLFGNVVEHG